MCQRKEKAGFLIEIADGLLEKSFFTGIQRKETVIEIQKSICRNIALKFCFW